MSHRSRLSFRVGALLLAFAAGTHAACPAPAALRPITPPRSVLILGNSLSGQLIPALTALAAPRRVSVVKHAASGPGLAALAEQPRTRVILAQRQWDAIVIQGGSKDPLELGTAGFTRLVQGLAEQARATSPCARIVLMQTWAYRPDHRIYRREQPGPDAMHTALRAAYRDAARAKIPGAPFELAPVGEAWKRAVAGGVDAIYARDGLHQSEAGAYLNAVVLDAVLTGRPAGKAADWTVEPALAARLREVAAQALAPAQRAD